MKEFLEAIAVALIGFPPVLANILTGLGGALVSVIVAVRLSTTPVGILDMIGQFVVCWLTGSILGPSIFAPVVQSIANKIPDYAICFLSSGVGWWFWTKLVPKKQDSILNQTNPPGNGTTP